MERPTTVQSVSSVLCRSCRKPFPDPTIEPRPGLEYECRDCGKGVRAGKLVLNHVIIDSDDKRRSPLSETTPVSLHPIAPQSFSSGFASIGGNSPYIRQSDDWRKPSRKTVDDPVPSLTFRESEQHRQERMRLYQYAFSTTKRRDVCPECEKELLGRISMRHHLRDEHKYSKNKICLFFHETIPVYPCPVCNKKRFISRSTLNQHAKKRHNLKSTEITKLLRKPVVRSARPKQPIIRVSAWVPTALRKTTHGDGKPAKPFEIVAPDSSIAEQQYSELMVDPALTVFLSDENRQIVLRILILKESYADVAKAVFGDKKYKPRVRKRFEKWHKRLKDWLRRGPDPSIASPIFDLLRGDQDAVTFELELSNDPRRFDTFGLRDPDDAEAE